MFVAPGMLLSTDTFKLYGRFICCPPSIKPSDSCLNLLAPRLLSVYLSQPSSTSVRDRYLSLSELLCSYVYPPAVSRTRGQYRI